MASYVSSLFAGIPLLSDRIFFPLSIIAAGLVVYVAFAAGPRSEAPNPLAGDPLQGFVIEGQDLQLVQSGPGLVHQFLRDEAGSAFIHTAAGQPPDLGIRSAGTFLTLLPEISEAWEGHTVHMSVKLRRPADNGSNNVFLRYYSMVSANSPAIDCQVSNDWQICELVYKIPVSDQPPNLSYIGIWPDTKGKSRYIDISQFTAFVEGVEQVGSSEPAAAEPN